MRKWRIDPFALCSLGLIIAFLGTSALVRNGTSAGVDFWLAQQTSLAHLEEYGLTVNRGNGLPVVRQAPSTASMPLALLGTFKEYVESFLAAPYIVIGFAMVLAIVLVGYTSSLGEGHRGMDKLWKRSVVLLIWIATIVFVSALILPRLFMRFGPYRFPLSYPDMFVTSGVAFYGFIVYQTWRHSSIAFVRWSAVLLLAIALTGGAVLPLFFGDFWATDVFGGGLLGGAILAAFISLMPRG